MKKLRTLFRKKSVESKEEVVDVQDQYIHRPMKTLVSSYTSPTSPTPLRKDYTVNGARVFALENFLTPDECKFYIDQTCTLNYESIDWEYTRDYRHCTRVVVKSKEFADLLWSRLLPFLNRDDLADVRPFGFGNEGVWKPTGINDCIRFSKYTKDGHFKPHRDGSFVWNEEERSIYTLQVYLNDECEGGATHFYEKLGSVPVAVVPKTGTALIFNHDVIHAGDTLKGGVKYILRTDIMFERVSAPMDEKSYTKNPEFKRMQNLYDMSIKAQKAHDPALSTKYYLEALEIQAKLRSIPSEINTRNEPWWLPNVIWLQILSFLSPGSLVSIGSTCHAFKRMSRDSELWYNLFIARWPLVKNESNDRVGNMLIKDWFHTYRYRHFADTTFQVVYIDFGASYTKYGVQGSQDGLSLGQKKVKSVIGYISGHYWSADSGYTNHIVGEEIETTFWDVYKQQHVYTETGKLDLYTMRELTRWMFQASFGYRPEFYSVPSYRPRLSPASHPILIARPRQMTTEEEKALSDYYFKILNVPYLLIKPSSELALFAVHKQSGIVVDGGDKWTSVAPVYKGRELTDKVQFFPIAGSKECQSYFSQENNLTDLVTTVLESCSAEERDEIEKTILLIGGTSFVWKDQFKKKFKKRNIIWEDDCVHTISKGAAAFGSLVNSRDHFLTRDQYLQKERVYAV